MENNEKATLNINMPNSHNLFIAMQNPSCFDDFGDFTLIINATKTHASFLQVWRVKRVMLECLGSQVRKEMKVGGSGAYPVRKVIEVI